MTIDTNELGTLAIRTESIVQDLNGQEANLRKALELVVIAGEILDQVKRKIYYGEKGEYNPAKLNAAAEKLAALDAFDFTHDEFVNGTAPLPALTNANTRIIHGIIGLCTEGAELAELLIKYIDTGSFDAVNLVEEVSDCAWYKKVIEDELGITSDDLFRFLIAKLSARYGDKFSSYQAVVRDLGTEREVMERILNR